MNHETVKLGKEKKLIGISVRTNNIAESNQKTGKIYPTMMKFYTGGILEQTEKLDCQVDSNLVYCVYTDYASDMNGDYTLFYWSRS